MSRWHGVFALLIVASLGGCGESNTITVTTPNPAVSPATTSTTATTQAATATSQPPASHPLLHFTMTTRYPTGTWPFTAQLAGITTNPNGFAGSDTIPPQDTYLMVQVNVTSLISGRTVPPPRIGVVCHGHGDAGWSYQGNDGYDEGSDTAPSPSGFYIATGDGQPHLWDAQWEVPDGTKTTDVRCVLQAQGGNSYYSGRVVGSSRLN